MTGLVTHVHHDLAIGLERMCRLLDRPQLRIGEIERDAEHGLLVRASPLVREIANRAKLPEPAPIEFFVQLPNVTFYRGTFNPQTQFADLLAEDPADLRVQGFESRHLGDYPRFSCINASVFPSPSRKKAIHSS